MELLGFIFPLVQNCCSTLQVQRDLPSVPPARGAGVRLHWRRRDSLACASLTGIPAMRPPARCSASWCRGAGCAQLPGQGCWLSTSIVFITYRTRLAKAATNSDSGKWLLCFAVFNYSCLCSKQVGRKEMVFLFFSLKICWFWLSVPHINASLLHGSVAGWWGVMVTPEKRPNLGHCCEVRMGGEARLDVATWCAFEFWELLLQPRHVGALLQGLVLLAFTQHFSERAEGFSPPCAWYKHQLITRRLEACRGLLPLAKGNSTLLSAGQKLFVVWAVIQPVVRCLLIPHHAYQQTACLSLVVFRWQQDESWVALYQCWLLLGTGNGRNVIKGWFHCTAALSSGGIGNSFSDRKRHRRSACWLRMQGLGDVDGNRTEEKTVVKLQDLQRWAMLCPFTEERKWNETRGGKGCLARAMKMSDMFCYKREYLEFALMHHDCVLFSVTILSEWGSCSLILDKYKEVISTSPEVWASFEREQ